MVTWPRRYDERLEIMIALTWNIYNGAIGASTPATRLTQIAQICEQYNVDVACLQEVPAGIINLAAGMEQGDLPVNSFAYAALNQVSNFTHNFGAYAVAWESPAPPPGGVQVTPRTTGGYLFLYRMASLAVRGQPNARGQWFRQGYFRQPYTGAYFRPPFSLWFTVTADGSVLQVLNQHAEASANDAQASAICFDAALAAAQPPGTVVVAADLNVSDVNAIATVPLFQNYADIVATYHVTAGANNIQKLGLDHILVSDPQAGPPAMLNTQLDFTSDSYHYPIAAEW